MSKNVDIQISLHDVVYGNNPRQVVVDLLSSFHLIVGECCPTV